MKLPDFLRRIFSPPRAASEDGWKWWQGPCECGVCEHRWRGVVEIAEDWPYPVVSLECPGCGSMCGYPEDGG